MSWGANSLEGKCRGEQLAGGQTAGEQIAGEQIAWNHVFYHFRFKVSS